MKVQLTGTGCRAGNWCVAVGRGGTEQLARTVEAEVT